MFNLFHKPRSPVVFQRIALYQPEESLKPRLGDPKNLTRYVKALQEQIRKTYSANPTPHLVDFVVLIAPHKLARCWILPTPQGAAKSQDAEFQKQFNTIPPPPANGPVAFAIQTQIAGGTSAPHAPTPPMPRQWSQIAAAHTPSLPLPDFLLPHLWPDVTFPPIPANDPDWVLQTLEPTAGKILKPREWHFVQQHKFPTFAWILSKEDPELGPYETGVRIQLFTQVLANAKKPASQFIKDIAQNKRTTANVLEIISPTEQGPFTRAGVKTVEGKFQLLYTIFWSDRLNVAIIATAGTLKKQWKAQASLLTKMSEFDPALLAQPTSEF